MPEQAQFHFREPKFTTDHENHHLDRDSSHRATPRLPPIPDLRFEYSYLRSIQPYVRVVRTEIARPSSNAVSQTGDEDDDRSYEKVEFSSVEGQVGGSEERSGVITTPASPSEVIELQWGKILWVTARDQIISPLVQGALWALAGYYLTPFSSSLGSKLGSAVHARLPTKEGSGITWLRNLFSSLNLKPSPLRT